MENNIDPVAQTLTHAIAMQEGGGKLLDYTHPSGDMPNAPAGTAGGRYQFMPNTWKAYAGEVLKDPNAPMTPENQNKVAYTKIKGFLDSGKTPAQAASMWNAGEGAPDAWKPGTVQKVGDTPTYVKNVQKYAQQLSSAPTQQNVSANITPPAQTVTPAAQGKNSIGYTPPAPPSLDTNVPPPEEPKSFMQKAGDVIGSVGNFLFPAVGDVSNLMQGKNTKTPLQIAGDVGLSVLPFIPGLGEVGLAGKVAEGAGLATKIAASPVARGALAGYGAGVSSNLAEGQNVGEALTPNLSNIGGAVLGGAAPIAMKGLGELTQKFAGISPQMANDLRAVGAGDTEGFQKYMDAAAQRTKTSMAPSAVNVAASAADTAAQKIKTMLSSAGGEVGKANRAAEAVALAPEKIAPVATSFNEGLADRFGVKLVTHPNGELGFIPTRRGGVTLTPQEQSRVLDVANRINEMGTGGNVRMADDIMSELDKKVDYGVGGQDPLKGLFKTVRGQLNGVAREASPEFAAANDKVVALKTLLNETQAMAGKDTQRGELLMRRVFTGDKGADVQALFDKIKGTTGIDLKKEALFAKYATEAFGNQDDKTLLEKMISGAGTGGLHGGMVGALIHGAQKAARAKFANPEKIGKKLIQGSQPSMVPGLITKTAARAGSSL